MKALFHIILFLPLFLFGLSMACLMIEAMIENTNNLIVCMLVYVFVVTSLSLRIFSVIDERKGNADVINKP